MNTEIGIGDSTIEVDRRPVSDLPDDPVRAVALDADLTEKHVGLDEEVDGVDIWREIMGGTLSLVDHFDTEHRRYYVAIRSDRNGSNFRALSRREQEVLARVAKGHSDKMIGYRLGVCKSTVGSYISSIKKKLGVSSRTALVRLVADFK